MKHSIINHNSFQRLKSMFAFNKYRPNGIKYEKRAFEFNAYDDDDHPSVPHGDSYPDHRYSIDLRDGTVWQKRKKVGHIGKKQFEALKRDKKIQEIIINAQAYYHQHHPQIHFDPIPWCPPILVNMSISNPTTHQMRFLPVVLDSSYPPSRFSKY